MYAKVDLALYEEAQTRRGQAQSIRADALMMQELVDSGRFITGAAGDTRRAIGLAASLFGLDPSVVSIIGDVPTAESINAINARMSQSVYASIIEGTNIRGSNILFQNIQQSMPNLLYTPEGNTILSEIAQAKAEYDITVANKMNEFRQKHRNEPNPLMPSNAKTFYEWLDEYDRTDPIVSDEIRNYLENTSKNPMTVQNIANQAFSVNISPQAREGREEARLLEQVPAEFRNLPIIRTQEEYNNLNVGDEFLQRSSTTGAFIRSVKR
jgi:hypothetical protein